MPKPTPHLSGILAAHPDSPLSGTGLFIDALKLAVETERAAEQAERRATHDGKLKLNPSISDLGKCPRKVYLSMNDVPESDPITIDSLINFAVGDAVGEVVLDKIERHVPNVKVFREVKVEIPWGPTKFTGRADAFLLFEDAGRLVEIKSINSRSLGFMVKNGEDGKADHKLQLGGYLYATHIPGAAPQLPSNLTEGSVAYIVKDATKGERVGHEAIVPFDAGLIEHEMMKISAPLLNPDPPVIPEGYEWKKYPCSYCEFRTYCHGAK